MSNTDPTWIKMGGNPLTQRFTGVTAHKHMYFDVPYMSHIEGNLWMGGCEYGLVLPDNIQTVVSLYPWEEYQRRDSVEYIAFKMYDSHDNFVPELYLQIAHVASRAIDHGETLIHCQAGLNRSGLVTGLVMLIRGMVGSGEEAVRLLREQRSPAVLCNQTFEDYLVSIDSVNHPDLILGA